MILIDKNSLENLDTVDILLTLSDVSDASQFVMELHSKFDGKDYLVNLDSDSSPFPHRFQKFICNSELFKDLTPGRYLYKIKENPSEAIVEMGVMMVLYKGWTDYVSPDQAPSDDDFISY